MPSVADHQEQSALGSARVSVQTLDPLLQAVAAAGH